MRDSVLFYRSFYEAIQTLPDEERLKAYEYIIGYGLNGAEPEAGSAAYGIYIMAKAQVDANNKRFLNGSRGGRPKTKEKPNDNQKETKNEPNGNQTVTKTKPKEKDKVNIKEKDAYASKKKSTGDPHGGQDEPCGYRIELSAGLELLPLADGTEWDCPMEKYQEFCRLYPGVDVAAEFRKMRGWCLERPAKRKTRRGIGAFVNGWLAREQDRYHPAARPADEKQGMMRDTDYNAVFGRGIGKILGGGVGREKR